MEIPSSICLPFSSQKVMVSQKNTAGKRKNTQFSFGTWNVRGLSAKEKKQQLGRDCHAYKLDLVCIQETKITNYDEITLASGHKLVLLQQKTAKHRGLGFVISPRLIPHTHSWWYISDRVAAIELSIPTSQGKSTYCRVINAYRPTLQKASENSSLLDCFYAELSKAASAPSRCQVFVCGNFNSKLGTLSPEDEEIGLSHNIGAHSKGKRNKNGEALLQFLIQQGLFGL